MVRGEYISIFFVLDGVRCASNLDGVVDIYGNKIGPNIQRRGDRTWIFSFYLQNKNITPNGI